MAHGDYACCAICDCKLYYVGLDAPTKEEICTNCLKRLHNLGANVYNVEELIAWIEKQNVSMLRETLKKLNYQRCRYDNEVDKIVKKKGIQFDENGYVK